MAVTEVLVTPNIAANGSRSNAAFRIAKADRGVECVTYRANCTRVIDIEPTRAARLRVW